ncbi:hypothetical protein HZH68_016614 [Vespula germanica]|uniref:Uncharacterized protein n=1 Tax=Vespula germanica TaxID=30212 RepID=A0A834J615_VESGE|nr:hypothetical protein HZH68_016614 [Vespula germanica]
MMDDYDDDDDDDDDDETNLVAVLCGWEFSKLGFTVQLIYLVTPCLSEIRAGYFPGAGASEAGTMRAPPPVVE